MKKGIGKRWKLGEVAVGGIIEVEIIGKILFIRALAWDNPSKVVSSGSTITNEGDAFWQATRYLNELTSSYYADKIMAYIRGKVELSNASGYLMPKL